MGTGAFEVRPEFQIREDVLGFGFHEGRIKEEIALQLIHGELLAAVQAATEKWKQLSFVVLDVRQVEEMSAIFPGKLIGLNGKLHQSGWTLVLFGLPREIRDSISVTKLDRLFGMVTDEKELRELIQRAPAEPDQAHGEQAFDFTEQELEEMFEAGITLEDAISAIERLRG